jgi:hypothetical protein
MSALHDLQSRFAHSIMGSDEADGLIVTDWLSPARRLAIYRHHFKSSLRDVLELSFPVVRSLVGEGFFNLLADAFTAVHPPPRACLAEYGENFSDFIAGFAPAQSLPYLADVALMEWALLEAAQAHDYAGKAFHTDYPVARIWQVDLKTGGGWIIIEKNAGEVQWRWLDQPKEQ